MSAATDMLNSLLFPNREQHAIPALDGAYSPNSALDSFPALDGTFEAPDDIAAGDGALFVSSGRRLLRVDPNNGAGATPIAEFEAPITAMTRLADGGFVVALNGAGLLHVDAAGTTRAKLSQLAGVPLRSVTAVAEDLSRGGVYFTVGSQLHDAEDWIWDLMESNRTGRLAYWPPNADRAEVLLDGLAYPNGLQVEDNGASLLFTQSWNHSLARYRLSGGPGQRGFEVVIDNMPGYPARIAPAQGGGHWLALFALRTQLVELMLKDRAFRREMMATVDPVLWIRPALRTLGSHLEPLQGGGIKKLGIRKPWAPPRSYGLVLRLDSQCEPLRSFHSRVDGRQHGIMAAREIDGRLYAVAKGNDCILVQDLDSLGANR